jgi:hypothetical protein
MQIASDYDVKEVRYYFIDGRVEVVDVLFDECNDNILL